MLLLGDFGIFIVSIRNGYHEIQFIMKKNLLFFLFTFVLFGFGQAQFSQQFVLLGEFTGAWCGFCPEGALIVDQTTTNNQQVIAVAIHNGDAMENQVGTDLGNFYSPSYPQALINRDGALYSRGAWASTCNTQTQGAGFVSVSFDSLNYEPSTREITATIKAFFTGPQSGDMRLNMYVVEKEVTGSGNGYDQVNYSNNTASSPLYQLGDPILNYTHKHVMRDALGGAWGTAGIISNNVNYGSTFTHTYTYTLPANIDENKVDLVAFVQKFGPTAADREILNSAEMTLPPVVGIEGMLTADMPMMEIAPNPFGELTKVAFTLQQEGNVKVQVLNNLGQEVAQLANGHMNSGAHTVTWRGTDSRGLKMESGIYMVRLLTETGQSLTKRVMLAN